MNTRKAHKIRSTIGDIILALLLFLFVIFVVMSPTIGNTGFYSSIVSDSAVTTKLQAELKEKTDKIAEQYDIEPLAFDFAVGKSKISQAQKEMVNGIFSGQNYDFSYSLNIEGCYRDGVTEYCRKYEIPLDQNNLEKAIPMLCEAFNSTLGIENSKEFKSFINILKHYSIYISIVLFVLIVLVALRIYTLSHGRTKVWSHFACSLVSSGLALVLLFLANVLLEFSENMYLTSNEAMNYVLAGASDIYFMICGAFGVAFIIGGASLLTYVSKYYTRKSQKNKQEMDINKTLYVKQEGGDKTIQEIVSDKRKQLEEMENDK